MPFVGTYPLATSDGAETYLGLNGAGTAVKRYAKPSREILTADRTYYVSTTGNNASDGLSAGTPWQTVRYAADWVARHIDLGGYTVKIQLADGGPYDGVVIGTDVTHPSIFGSGNFWIQGNPTDPYLVNMVGTVAEGFGWGSNPGVQGFLSDLKVESTSTTNIYCSGSMTLGRVGGGGRLIVGRSAASWASLVVCVGGNIQSLCSNSTGGLEFDTGGNAYNAWGAVYNGGVLNIFRAKFVGVHTFTTGLVAAGGGVVQNSFTDATGATVTGKKYQIDYPGDIDRPDLENLPGSIAGAGGVAINKALVATPAAALTASVPGLTVTQTWNNAGVVFAASSIDITDTASALASRFADWRKSTDRTGAGTFRFDKSGTINIGLGHNSATDKLINIYSFWDGGANYEYFRFGWNGNVTEFGTAAGGTGVVRSMNFVIGSAAKIRLEPAGPVLGLGASHTPSVNGELVIEATSNTSLTFKLKGSDGTVRSASLTLA